MIREPIILSWSGGKDCALALSELRRSDRFEIVALATSFCRETDRIAIHDVDRSLIREQSKALGIKLDEIDLPAMATNVQYEAAWGDYFSQCRSKGVSHVAFGDLFLNDIREYREQFLERLGMTPLFPLWGRSTTSIAESLIRGGWKAVVCSVDPSSLGVEFTGRLFNESFLNSLPPGVDPCGENGEFHTFLFDGPEFLRPVDCPRFGKAS